MLELEEALAQILATLPPPVSERISLREAHGRVLAERISAPIDLPVFDNSSMDGYAVRAGDIASANSDHPARLRLIGAVAAGQDFRGEVAAGTCVRVLTGSPLPRGADAVVMQEDTRVELDRADEISVLAPEKPWANVRFHGEDVKRGTVLAEAGECVSVGLGAQLAAVGLTHVKAGRRPVVGLLATGSELKEAGEPLGPGQIYESNRVGLAPLVRRAGGVPRIFPVTSDTRDETCAALDRALAECHLVVTCGGISAGEMDFVKGAFEQVGGRLQFWKVAVKPGKPFAFGRRGERFLFGLPGNPVSAFVTFLLFVRPALLRWQGARVVALPAAPGVLTGPLFNSGDRRHFMRVTVDAAGGVRSAGIQASHVLSAVAAANGLVDVPPNTTLAAGTAVRVFRWE